MRHHVLVLALVALPAQAWSSRAAAQSVGDDGPGPSAILPGPTPSPAPAPPARETPLAVLEGRVRAIDAVAHTVVLDVAGGAVTLAVDRNTLVYLPAGLSTVLALRPGDEVRAGRNDRNLAYWMEVHRPSSDAHPPVPTPGQGTGPGGGAPTPPERGATAPGFTGTPR